MNRPSIDILGIIENRWPETGQRTIGDHTIVIFNFFSNFRKNAFSHDKHNTNKMQHYTSFRIDVDEIHQKLTVAEEERIESQDDILEQRKQKLTRKRKNNFSEWACDKRKEKFDNISSGKKKLSSVLP